MTITISSEDPRSIKAVEIAAGAHQWLKCRAADGSKRYGIPSQRVGSQYQLVDHLTCTCYDGRDHLCKHVRAVRLWVQAVHRGISVDELIAMPASDVVDGLEQMVSDRRPVLTMVRHPDGEITWERPKPTAAEYDRIFGKL
jgi:hypothetical protein